MKNGKEESETYRPCVYIAGIGINIGQLLHQWIPYGLQICVISIDHLRKNIFRSKYLSNQYPVK